MSILLKEFESTLNILFDANKVVAKAIKEFLSEFPAELFCYISTSLKENQTEELEKDDFIYSVDYVEKSEKNPRSIIISKTNKLNPSIEISLNLNEFNLNNFKNLSSMNSYILGNFTQTYDKLKEQKEVNDNCITFVIKNKNPLKPLEVCYKTFINNLSDEESAWNQINKEDLLKQSYVTNISNLDNEPNY